MQDFEQGFSNKIGILITNLGTPDAPDKKSLKKYLRQFLSDRRVVDYNPFFMENYPLWDNFKYKTKKIS